jgi:hypothetical protein
LNGAAFRRQWKMNLIHAIKPVRWTALAVTILFGVLYFGIYPCAEDSRIKQAADDLRKNYDLIVRYEDPADFFVPPLEVVDKDPKIRIERAEKNHVYAALKGIGSALEMYPPMLVRKYLAAVFIARTLEINGVTGAAMFANSWIYVAVPARDELGNKSYELSLHHELSSLLFYGGEFPTIRWHLVNEPEFQYLDNQVDIIKAAALSNRKDPEQAETWHAAGFVSDYGMASMENDVNTFAELMMGDPDKLLLLCNEYPKIAQKKNILIQFYTKLAPEMSTYFNRVGLAANSDRESAPLNSASNGRSKAGRTISDRSLINKIQD